MFFCIGTKGSKCSLFRSGWFQCFSVYELKVPKVPYLEMGGSNGLLFRNCRFQWSNGSLFRNGWFQCFCVWELKVPMVSYLEMGGSKVFLFRY